VQRHVDAGPALLVQQREAGRGAAQLGELAVRADLGPAALRTHDLQVGVHDGGVIAGEQQPADDLVAGLGATSVPGLVAGLETQQPGHSGISSPPSLGAATAPCSFPALRRLGP
jgi:hypothetical protein